MSSSERPRLEAPVNATQRPILKALVWKPEIGAYFFSGGLAGASALLAFVARGRGNHRLARRALLTAAAGAAVSPALLISDLGRPERFHHMLRVFKVTSPMSVGTWLLSGFGAAIGVAAASEVLGVLRPVGLAAEGAAALLGPGLATYTAVLITDTAVPAWHEAHRELPFVFAGSAAASAGAAAAILTPAEAAGPARRLAVLGAVGELAAAAAMKRRLGALAQPYEREPVRSLDRLAQSSSIAGAAILGLLGRRRPAAILGGALVLAGSICQRFAIFRAGFDSARPR